MPFHKSCIWTCLSREKDQEGEAQILVTGFSRTGNGWTPWCEVIYVKWGDQKTHYGSSNGKLCTERISASVDPPSTVFSLWTFSWRRAFIFRNEIFGVGKQGKINCQQAPHSPVVLAYSQESSLRHFCQISPIELNLNVVVVIWEAMCEKIRLLFCILQGGGKRPRLQCPLVSLEGICVHVHIQYLRQYLTHMQVIIIMRDANKNIYSKGSFRIKYRCTFLFFARKIAYKSLKCQSQKYVCFHTEYLQ